MVRKNLILFIATLVTGAVSFLTIGYSAFAASDELDNKISTVTEYIPVNSNLSLEMTTETYTGYEIISVTDNQGNISISDSRKNYVLENGEKIGVTIDRSSSFNSSNSTLKTVPAWQYLRTNTITVAFDKTIKEIAIGTLLSKVKAVLGYAYSAVAVVKAAYEKPDLHSSKSFYLKTNIYAKTNQLNYEGRHTFSLDAKKRVIKNTNYFSNTNLKKF